jgi:hypothetical protein
MLRRATLICYTLLAVFSLSGCSLFGSSASDINLTPEVKAAVKRVAAEYIGSAVDGNFRYAQSLILWSAYLANKGGNYSKVTHLQQMGLIKKIGAVDSNPLLNLQIKSFETSDNEVTITAYNQLGTKNQPGVSVTLLWAGQGWLIVDDSIYGPNGLAVGLAPSSVQNSRDSFSVK